MTDELYIGAAARAQQAEDSNIGNCGRTWHVGFFFDGVGRDIEQDASEDRLSNIARLFRAYPDKSADTDFICHNKFYFQGMGTLYKEETISKLYTAMDVSLESIQGDVEDIPKDAAEDIGKDILTSGKKWFESMKHSLQDLIKPAEVKNLRNEILTNALKRTLIESTPWIRDSEVMSSYFMTGEPTRIGAAIVQFASYFEEHMAEDPVKIKAISISLYGFDLGATLARKFLDKLLDEVCEKKEDAYFYKSVPVHIVFTGFFDCSRHTPASSNNGLDYFVALAGGPVSGISVFLGEKCIEQDSALPEAVRNALHLVAAHERRPWRGLYMLGRTDASHKEMLLPGCSEDVGGGLKPNEQKPSAELCRVALQQMYRAAFMAGVPFPDFSTLDKFDTDVASYFVMNDYVQKRSVRSWVECYQQEVTARSFSVAALDSHLDNYIVWLGEQYYLYKVELQQLEEEKSAVYNNPGNITGTLGVLNSGGYKKLQPVQEQINQLTSLWGWLDDVFDAALDIENYLVRHPNDRRLKLLPGIYNPALARAQRFLKFSECAFKGEPIPEKATPNAGILYAWFVHDLQKVEKGASITMDFFVRRSAEIPEVQSEENDKDEQQSPPNLSGGD
ncbi:hypothetical protein CKH23_17560 [Salmonella enterica]|nr:DUF2235 domain-containing protein [Salmonella enterica]EBK3282593.1 hypothetical protein [Salmonella enterica]